MQKVALVLSILAVVMLGVIGWRLTGGPLGPKSYAFMAVTAGVIVAAVISWRRSPPRSSGTPTASV